MKAILEQMRGELTESQNRFPLLTLAIAGAVLLMPIALLGSGVVDVFVSIAAALFLLRSILEGDFKWVREPWVAIALVLWLYLIGRGLLSVDPDRSSLKALSWIRFIVFGCAVYFILARSETARRVLLYSIVFMAIFGAADALFQFVVGHDIFGRPKESGERLTGPLRNPSIGFLLVIVGLPAMLFLWREVQKFQAPGSYLALAGAGLILATVFLSGERLAFLQALAATAVIALVLRVSVRTIAAAGTVAVALAVGLLTLSNADIASRQWSTITEFAKGGKSIYLRTMHSGIEVIEDNPVFGVGLKNFRASCSASATVEEVGDACHLIHPHQIWLHITAETGLIGAAGFLAIFVLALSPAIRAWRSWQDQPLLAGSTIAILFLLVPFAPSGNFFSNWREAIFWFLLATAAAMGRIVQQRQASVPARAEPRSAPAEA